MASCLGIYIEEQLIKYAKVSKSNENLKVEAFGIKFYDDFEKAIKQIVDETYSYKIPISINITGEIYNKFEVFKLLSKKDMDGVIKTEFENFCYEKDMNKNIFEERYVFANEETNSEKAKVIHVAVPKTNIAQKKNQFPQYKISNMSPVATTIPNLIKNDKKITNLIVNIENQTTITKITDNYISDVVVVPIGAKNILDNINRKENSYSKSYEICKNVTIYTDLNKDLQYEENEYLEDIMPTLFQIVSEVRKVADQSFEQINTVYITGTASVVNNIDIYFQDYLKDMRCEILKPSFINNNSKINIKDYIEVNSAISLAKQGLENNKMNFSNESAFKKLSTALNSDISISSIKDLKISTEGINNAIDKIGGQYNVIIITASLILLSYILGTIIINKQFNMKIANAETSISNTQSRIQKIETYNSTLNNHINEYKRLISNIENINDANSEDKRFKKTIPNLLNNIMAIIPKGVQLTLIENTEGTHIVINATSEDYEQAAYFKAKLKTEGILKNVVSDTGTASGGFLNITIEGELP